MDTEKKLKFESAREDVVNAASVAMSRIMQLRIDFERTGGDIALSSIASILGLERKLSSAIYQYEEKKRKIDEDKEKRLNDARQRGKTLVSLGHGRESHPSMQNQLKQGTASFSADFVGADRDQRVKSLQDWIAILQIELDALVPPLSHISAKPKKARKKKCVKITPKIKAKLRKARKSGKTLRQISGEFGISIGAISRHTKGVRV